ncbi:oxygen-sensing cyclic-di-GMP phosphodiesterase [Pseudomonas sp. FW306-02-F02-AA]|uniref:Histidine kinase n=1 Tax=Pseudomonas fluorescens TaxID=294 RepID=A0A0N9WFN5_PSEFL|nr:MULTISPECIES: PAS domain-containing protein [Pseudomonas]ALI00429.1 histidine kinase [Pseudomonas fluorescens]PMZ01215.1 oxygen-sensing cyclic-di-GMP phosphodiesterase [Pseudomonas sp. FW306-02-F02-AB]PMZ07126.1 oxygen-sensing cyclic-di-GMP phosphodiesterase [Pseudomonas sp. FW306-02-H06C]PMZ16343.1 oxygen-sensing cyclic-di-GMP phosphodiesterase [Pseudomonas sp. FW306-02-F02-AA]PMZ22284.1 oxygen-sensing cyclic-di-GMP phosphodiesterase [Pseudomonas sp. FW306-02-F08-AA]
MINAQLMQLAINASNDGIVIAEREGEDNILIYVNPAFEKLTGYSAEEILYQDCRFLQSGDRDQAALSLIRETLKVGKSCREILHNYRKDGTHFWNELSLSTVYNENDKQTYFIGVQKDVTLQVKTQQRVNQLEAQLAEVQAELQALKATNGQNQLSN